MDLGLFPVPDASRYGELRAQVELADRGGLDFIAIQDHPYQRRFLDTFALIGDLLARTERLRFMPAVANLPLRDPAMLAKQAASLDLMSGGRFELGLGAGAFGDAVAAMGGPRRTPKEGVDALEEAIALLRRAWAGERGITAPGPHYPVRGYHAGPLPAHPIGILLGAYRPRMLRLTGRAGDGWLPSSPYAPPEAIPEMQDRIDDGAAAAGRDPSAVRRIYIVTGTIADGPARDRFTGPPEHWIETLAEFAGELRFDGFAFSPTGDDPAAQIERFVREVAPGLRL